MIVTTHKSGACCSAGKRGEAFSSSLCLSAQQNAPTNLTEPGRRPVALPAPSQTAGRHEFSADAYAAHDAFGSSNREQGPCAAVEAPDQFSLTSAVPPSRALATAGASASAFSSEVA